EVLHANVWGEVLRQIALSNIRNYSIYRYGNLLFSYYEYVGDDLDADLAVMAQDPATRRWWALCSPLQYSGDPLKATDLAKAIIAANPDLKGLYGTNEGAAIGVVHAVQELGIQGKLTIIGFDSGKDQVDA